MQPECCSVISLREPRVSACMIVSVCALATVSLKVESIEHQLREQCSVALGKQALGLDRPGFQSWLCLCFWLGVLEQITIFLSFRFLGWLKEDSSGPS